MTHDPSTQDAATENPTTAWRYDPRKPALLAAALTLGLWLVTTDALAEQVTGTGTAVVTSYVITATRQEGGNTIMTLEVSATLTGILQGTSQATETAIVYPNGTTNIQAVETFTGSVNGVSGTLVFKSLGTLDAAGTLEGSFTILSASDCLDGVRGHGSLHSASGNGAYEVTLVYPNKP